MRLACIVLAHRGPGQLAFFLSCLRHPDVRIYLHLDRRVDAAPFRRALADAGIEGVTHLERFRTPWGGIGAVDAQLAGLRRALADGCEYFVLLSGQDFPARPVEETVARFAAAPERSYVPHFPLPDPRWAYGGRMRTEFYTFDLFGRMETHIPPGEPRALSWKGELLNRALGLAVRFLPERRFPAGLRPYGGWSWWNLSRRAARHVVAFVERHPGYRAYHRHTLSADEVFVHSILMGGSFAGADDVVDEDLRFLEWDAGGTHPRILRMDDLDDIVRSGRPFARKFDEAVDGEVLRALADAIGCAGPARGGA